jgi:hypothetical protein
MTEMREAAYPDWQFDGSTIIVRIPIVVARRGRPTSGTAERSLRGEACP